MRSGQSPRFDVFVGPAATPDLVRRTLLHYLNTEPFDTDGAAVLGRHAHLRAAPSRMSEAPPPPLLRHGPLDVSCSDTVHVAITHVRPLYDLFEHEATAWRVFTALRAQGWPVALLRDLRDVLDWRPGR